MGDLKYRGYHVDIEALQLNECTVRGAGLADGTKYWMLWFCVNRDSDGAMDVFGVPINPNGSFVENGPGGKTWGLTNLGSGQWQVAPSINVLNTRDPHPGEHPAPSLWHQTPKVIGVPDGEPWS